MSLEVLIIGAGPTGLATACALAKNGIQIRIIDKNKSRSDKSKALGVQAGTLECLRKVFGSELTGKMVRAGRPAQRAFIHLNDEPEIKIEFNELPTDFNFILILAQSETEKFLEEELNSYGVVVERETEFLSLTEEPDLIRSQVKSVGSANAEQVTSSFVIGCDGAHSGVRKAMGVSFEGDTYSGDFILGDVVINWPWPYDAVRTFVNDRGAIASFPMNGERTYRLILIPHSSGVAKKEPIINFEEFSELVNQMSRGLIKVERSTWLTRFSVHHRIVSSFQRGRLFLAGDAAHIHSPAGGQGMNTGIQDGLNLAFKLKSHLKQRKDLWSLMAYTRERLPVAHRVLYGTDLVFRLALQASGGLTRWARRHLAIHLIRRKWLQKRVVLAISELRPARREIEKYNEGGP